MLKTLEIWFLWVMLYSFIGWVYESVLCSLRRKKLVNRGFLNGPYCPIYGNGALLVILLLGNIRNPFLLFFLGALVTSSLEYLTSYVMEKLFHARWWDYSARRFNLKGRVCLIGAVVFGAFSVVLILGLHPPVRALTDRLSAPVRHSLCAALLAVLCCDCFVTIRGLFGFREGLEKLTAELERQKAALAQRRRSGYLALPELRAALKQKLNSQQRRMLRAFPALKLHRPHEDSLLQKLRAEMKHIEENRRR